MCSYKFPKYKNLPVNILSSCFDKVTNSYKFYWFLSILDCLRDSDSLVIPIKELSLRMVSLVWYPLDYYHLSFGKQDGFKDVSEFVSSKIEVDHKKKLFEQFEKKIKESDIRYLYKLVNSKTRYVPYRFIRPFFIKELRGIPDGKVDKAIVSLTKVKGNYKKVFYTFENNNIVLNKEWAEYFNIHQKILRDFIKWNLILFLQKNNPNVIGLSEKLEKPISRVLNNAKNYWKQYISYKECKCIYSNEIITPDILSIDHFIPWSYIAHDLIWNLIPTTRCVNSSKSDYLPSYEKYFNKFVSLQYDSYKYNYERGNMKLLEDYTLLFADTSDSIYNYTIDYMKTYMSNYYKPLFQTAKNMGFSDNWIYKN